ncbi:MAG: hypothetical protein B6U72_06410 [Candidatus Altiarchaeales archaeon ex4484_2]|nr:MAG: hypothetical protein B6U72_06410 [Candidatus Altiarchaeales archaeon ex4484_2]
MKKMDSKGQGAMEYLMTYGWAIMVVMIVGVVLWQMGIFKMGSGGSGMSGFGAVKPLDHASPSSGNINISFTNAAGARITNIAVSVDGISVTPSVTDVAPGNKFTAGGAVATVCPTNAETYDASVNVTYTNSITGLGHTGSGRIWGPC